jgi:CheY-like chemotaxis protein
VKGQAVTLTKTAVVADESAEIRRAQSVMLKTLGFLPIEATDGFQVLDRLRKIRPNLIVMDLAMPGLDGTEVLHFIRRNEEWKDLPVLVCSALADTATRKLVLRVGGTAFLPKNAPIEALRDAVASLLLPNDSGRSDRPGIMLPLL